MSAMRVVVVGGGIVGAATALRLAQDGASVTLLEADRLASGTSSSTFAWVNANDKPPFTYHALNVAGMGEHLRLAQELDGSWLHIDGHVTWATSDREQVDLTAHVDRLAGWGYPVERLSLAELERMEPGLAVPARAEWVAHFPSEGWVDAPGLIATACREAEAAGALVHTGVRVVGFDDARGGGIQVTSEQGSRYTADAVVICTGADADAVAQLTGGAVPMANITGLVATIDRVPVTVRTTITSASVNVRPDGVHRCCVQAPALDPSLDREMAMDRRQATAIEIQRRAAEVVPALSAGVLSDIRVGVRPIPLDGLPVVGELIEAPGVFVAVSHSGITLGPLLGRLVARQVLTGEVDDRLRHLGPNRFQPGSTDASPL